MRCLPLFLLLTLTACSPEQESLEIRLTMAERDVVDARVSAYMDSIRPILDSLCTTTFDDRVAVATDSIVQRRLEEEARLRARIPENLRNGR